MIKLIFEFPADTAILEKIGEVIAKEVPNAGFSSSEVYDIQLAVDEACTNTIIHGLKKDPMRKFKLIIQCDFRIIEISIHETGIPFNPLQIKQPDIEALLEDRPVGGLGFYFVKKLMDEVEYKIDENGVKILRMVKKIKC